MSRDSSGVEGNQKGRTGRDVQGIVMTAGAIHELPVQGGEYNDGDVRCNSVGARRAVPLHCPDETTRCL